MTTETEHHPGAGTMTTMQSGDILRQIDRLFAVGTVAGLSDAQLLSRYIARREEAAFVTLVARHGPMVLAVCRGVLRDPHAAEDAFQATFLILVRRAGSLWVGESLGGWLHRVAYRVALQTRADTARRRARELKAAGAVPRAAHPEGPDDHLRGLLHEEIGRLPDRLRLPVVLCELEGLTRDQAAERLRWSEGTVRGRLARARAKLRERLTRRGVTLSAAAMAAALASEASAAPVPDLLLTATIRAVAGQGVTAFTAVLTAQIVRAMFLTRVKGAAIVTLFVGALAWASAVLLAQGERPNPRVVPPSIPPAAHLSAPPAKHEEASVLVFHGRVVDAKDGPVAGAKLYLVGEYKHKSPPLPRATSAADGQYRFSVSSSDLANPASPEYLVLAKAEGFAVAFSDPEEPANNRDHTLRLVEVMPIEGRVFDLEGRPVVGATVKVTSIWTSPSGDLTPWLRAIKAREGDFFNLRTKHLRWYPLPGSDGENLDDFVPPDILPRLLPATTDAQGRFRLNGVGRESVADLRIEAPSIRTTNVPVMTRPGKVVQMPSGTVIQFADKPTFVRLIRIHGASPQLVVAPSRPIEGVVRDQQTGKPIAGATIQSHFIADEPGLNLVPRLSATSDAHGRYRLTGMPGGPGNQMIVLAPSGQPYLSGIEKVEYPSGLGPVSHDITLTRGILIEGRVTSKATGKPPRARVQYYPAADNPELDTAPGFRQTSLGALDLAAATSPDGTFKIVGLPGRGLLIATTDDDASPLIDSGERATLAEFGPFVAGGMIHAFAKLDVPPTRGPVRQDLQVDQGRTLTGTVLDPAGEPLTGAFIYGLVGFGYWEAARGSSFELRIRTSRAAEGAGMSRQDRASVTTLPGSIRTLVFQHEGRKLAGWVDVDEKSAGPLRVTLEPWSTVSGRVTDAAGKPRADLVFVIYLTDKPRPGDDGIEHRPERVRTDAAGRFRIEGLAPGLRYQLFPQPSPGLLALDDTRAIEVAPTKPGESRDSGGPPSSSSPTIRDDSGKSCATYPRSLLNTIGRERRGFRSRGHDDDAHWGRLAADRPTVRGGDDRGAVRRAAPGSVSHAARRGVLRGAGVAARADGAGGLPGRAPRPARGRGCLPGYVPDPGPQGRLAPGRRVTRRLAVPGRLPGGPPGPRRCRPPPRAGEKGRGGSRS